MYKVQLLIVLFTLSIISVSYAQQTQPENVSFEEWEDVGLDTEEPVNWSSIKTSDDSFLNGLAPYVWDKSTDAHTGNYSVKLFSVPILSFVAAGAITNGRVHADFDPSNGYMFTDPTDDRWNTPINTRPDSVAVWVKFLPQGSDTAQVKALLHTGEAKLPDPTQSNWVGLSLISVPNATNGWVRVSAPFEYFNNTTPEYILFVVSSAGTVATEGTEVYYDDFELIYNPVIPNFQAENPGFELWEDVGLNTDEPVDWSSIKTSDDSFINGLAPYVWDKSTDAHSGNYSVKLFSAPILSIVAAGAITNGRVHANINPDLGYMYTDINDSRWNTPFAGKPDSIAVWLKYLPQGADTAQVKVILHTGTAKIPDPTMNNWVGSAFINVPETTNGWMRFSAPIDYLNNTEPEYVLFVVSTAGTIATEGTIAYYDDFEFIYNPPKLDLTVFLEGPYRGAKKMNTHLNPDLLPLSQPYNMAPWFYNGTESVSEIPDNVVDWCLVEVRDAASPDQANSFTIKKRWAAFLLNNGDIVDLDGSSKLTFDSDIDHNLYVVVKHRNHLGAISAYPLTEEDGIYAYDFSNGVDKIYGGSLGNSQLVVFGPALWGIAAGNGDANKTINMNDKTNFWSVFAGKSGYHSSDYNLDGQITNQDKNKYWQKNLDKTSQVPN